MRLFLLLLTLLVSLPALAQEPPQESHVQVRLLANADAAVPGQTVTLGVQQLIVPGWHTYWRNPGDSGEAMNVKWALPSGYQPTDLLWPAPRRVPYGPLMNFGYTDEAVMLTDLAIPANAPIGQTLALRANVNVLVCDEICIPETQAIALDLPIRASSSPANAELFAGAARKLPQIIDWATNTEIDANEVRVRVTLPSYAADIGKAASDMEFFPLEWGYIENASDQRATFEPSTGTLTLRQQRASGRDIAAIESAGYVLTDGEQAWQFAGPIKNAPAASIGAMAQSAPDAVSLDTPLLLMLLFAFLGGMILNLMPCVFPVLSMKALHLVALPQGERGHASRAGVFYALGVVAMFLVLGAVLLALRGAGEQLGWGFQLQNPATVALLAWLLFTVGLNLIGAFDLRIAFGGEMLLAGRHHPLVAAFLTGVLATLVATPCSAPFMATAIGAALTQSPAIALLIFAFVGLGLAAPFVVLCCSPALQKILPRPGAWMETFRQLLAFPMFASVIWLVWVLAQQGGPGAVAWALTGMLGLGLAIWLFDRQPVTRARRMLAMAAGGLVMLATLSTLAFIVPRDAVSVEDPARTDNARAFTPDALETALKGNTPVFVNMTASWCITCLVNERVALDTPAVHDLFAAKNLTYLKGDWTNRDPAITAYLQSFRRSGVPLYVLYPARQADGQRPPAMVLPQILSLDTLAAALEPAK